MGYETIKRYCPTETYLYLVVIIVVSELEVYIAVGDVPYS